MKKITFLLLLGLTGAANAQNTITPKEMADLFLKGETIQPDTRLLVQKTEEKKSETGKEPINSASVPKNNNVKPEVVKSQVIPKIEQKKVEVVKTPIVPPVTAKVEDKKIEVVKAPVAVVPNPKVEEKKVEVVKVPVVTVVVPKAEEKKIEIVVPLEVKLDENKVQPPIQKVVKKKIIRTKPKAKPLVASANNVMVPATGVIVSGDSYAIPRSKIEQPMEYWKKPLTPNEVQVSLELVQPDPDDKRSYFEVNIKDLRTGLPIEDFYLKNVNGTSAKVNVTQIKSNLTRIQNHELDLNGKNTINAESIACSAFIVSYQLSDQENPVNVSFILNRGRLSVDTFGKDCVKPEVTKERTIVTKSNLLVNYNVSPRELANNVLSINMYVSKDGQYMLPRHLKGYAISEDFKNVSIMIPENKKGYLVNGMDFKKKKDAKDYYLVFDFYDELYNNVTYSILD